MVRNRGTADEDEESESEESELESDSDEDEADEDEDEETEVEESEDDDEDGNEDGDTEEDEEAGENDEDDEEEEEDADEDSAGADEGHAQGSLLTGSFKHPSHSVESRDATHSYHHMWVPRQSADTRAGSCSAQLRRRIASPIDVSEHRRITLRPSERRASQCTV